MRKTSTLIIVLLALTAIRALSQQVTLDDYLRIARERSPLLRDYRNAILSLSIDSQKIRAGYTPQVAVNSVNSYAPTFGAYGYDEAITNGGQFSTLLGANKTFASRNNLNTQFRALQLSRDSVSTASMIAEQDLARTVTAQYLTAYGDQQLMFANDEIGSMLGNEDMILRKLTQNNVYRQTDYLTFLVTQKQQGLQRQQLRIQYLTDYNTLNYLCGIIDTAGLSKTLTLPAIEVRLFDNTLGSAFFRKYLLDSLRLQNDMKLINLAYRPRLTAFADAGYNTSQLRTFYNNFGASGGFAINLPIYDGGRRKQSLRQVGLLEDTRQGYRQFFELQYTQQIGGLLQQLSATQSLLVEIEAQISYSKGLIDVNEKLLQTGDARIPDFVIAINNYLTARTLLTQNRISRLQIINQVNYWNR